MAPRVKPSPVHHRIERRRRALSGLADNPYVVWSSGWLSADEMDELLDGPMPAELAALDAACPVGGFGIPRQDRH